MEALCRCKLTCDACALRLFSLLTPCNVCMQAKLPGTLQPGHCMLQPELHADARLHAAIRQGNVAAIVGLSPVCPVPPVDLSFSSISPTSTAAALFWYTGDAEEEGVVMASKIPGTATWASNNTPAVTYRHMADCSGRSGSGRYFGCLHHAADAPHSSWAAQFYDTTALCWLPELQLNDSALWAASDASDIIFCGADTLAAVPVEG